MAIKSYLEDNILRYEVYVSKRSKLKPSIRVQKRKNGIESKGKAERLEKEIYQQCVQEILRLEGKAETWAEVIEKYKSFRLNYDKIQLVTLEDYYGMLKIWTSNFWSKPVTDITRADVRASLESAQIAGKSNSHLTKLLHTINRVHKWAKDEGLCPPTTPSITQGLKVSKIENRAPKILSWEELQFFLEKAKELENPWFPVWATAIHTGMRSGELYALKWASVDLNKKTILVDESYNKRKKSFKSTKSGCFRVVPINDYLYGILLALKNVSTTNFVLPRLKDWDIGHQAKAVQIFCSEIGLPIIHFHTFRACFATHLLANGVPLGQVMKCAGWAELKTVQRYNRLAGVNERGATDCLNALAPVSNVDGVLKFGN